MSFEHIKSYTTRTFVPELPVYVQNPNNDTGYIMSKADFANVTTWQSMQWDLHIADLPAAVYLLYIHLLIRDGNLSEIRFRHPDVTGDYNNVYVKLPVINLMWHVPLLIPYSNGFTDYRLSIGSASWTNLNVDIIGWFM